MTATKSRIVRIGNSRGVRLPKSLIEQAGLRDEIELHVRGNTIVVAPARRTREGWAEAARKLAAEQKAGLLDAPTSTTFDEHEWQW